MISIISNRLEKESVGEALFALADTPRKLYVGTTSAIVSLDKQTLKSEVLFHQKELFTHNYNTLLLDSKKQIMVCCRRRLCSLCD